MLTGGVNHIERSQYFFNSGLLAASCGENFPAASACANTYTPPQPDYAKYSYDGLNRLLSATSADGGQTTLAYNEASLPITVTSTTKIDATQNLVETAIYDGLGRTKQTQQNSNPLCTVKVDMTYDEMGRQKTVTNPHCTTSDPTYGITTHDYDALGRVTKVIPPDGTAGANHVTTSYSGNMTTVTDQQGKQRRSWTDALGRLIQVNEPNPTLATPAWTQYTYDALDNLTQVVQSGSRQRTFTYNSLSQLLTASNPESGAISYTYDNDGNLITKTDARGIVATHSYDQLHRLTLKSFSDSTPRAEFYYDEPNPWGWPLPNTVGRMSRQQAVQGSTVIVGAQFGYDEMGRVIHHGQCTPSTCGVGGFDPQADYDLAGNLAWLTYPSGRKVTYGYDTASRLNQVRFDSFNGTPVGYNYLSSASYHPHGAPHVTTLGSGLVETNTYNSRLQPLQMTGVTGAFTYFNKQYNFYDASNRNNGNVMRIADQLNAGRSQNFSYDELNRLDQAWTDANSGADCWGLGHGYDIWANLLSATVTRCSAPMLSVSVNTQNRINGFGYDAAGNLTADGTHTYQWDAESRMKSLDTIGATYTYDADGNRVRKQVGSDSTEYIYFAGQVIAERNTAGEWSDYIYAGSRRLARTDTYEDRIRIWGTRCSGCGSNEWYQFIVQSPASMAGYQVQPGDKLYWRQWQGTTTTFGGINIQFTDWSESAGNTLDQGGQDMNAASYHQMWHYRRVDLSAHAGKTINQIRLSVSPATQPGFWEIYYHEIVLVSADGTVHIIYDRQKTVNLSGFGSAGMTGTGYDVNHIQCAGQWCYIMTTYFHGDHLGSSRMTSSHEGYPTWSATYLPFGQEHNPQPTTNHYKFTGKERDSESNLDYSIARYYGSSAGRFTSPDPESAGASPLDPQSWNAYAYARNNPLLFTDPSGKNYIVCIGDERDQECWDLTDEQYKEFRKSNPELVQTPEGNLELKDPNGPNVKIGTAKYYNEKVAEALIQAGQMADVGVTAAMLATSPNFAVALWAQISLGGVEMLFVNNVGHHAVPKFLGGLQRQILSRLSPRLHNQFHNLLRNELRNRGFPSNMLNGGRTGSTRAWEDYMSQNPSAQRVAFDAVLKVAKSIDGRYGTQLAKDVVKNLASGNFTPVP